MCKKEPDKLKCGKKVEIYPDIINWLQRFLRERFPRHQIDIRDTHSMALNRFVERHQLTHYFDTKVWQTYDIRADITGFVAQGERLGLVLVECKTTPITIAHISKLWGYCRVAQPSIAYLISTSGIGDAVRSLILSYGRTDILEYHWAHGQDYRSLILAKWDEIAKTIDMESVLPPGALSHPVQIGL